MAIVFLEVLHLLFLGGVINAALRTNKFQFEKAQRTSGRYTATTSGNQTSLELASNDYINSYYDYDEYSYEGSEFNVTEAVLQGVLRKCHCGAHQILVQGSDIHCSSFETVVKVFHPITHEEHVFNTSHFSRIKVEELKCDEGYFKYELPADSFILEPTENGMKLYGDSFQETFSIDSYCIDHIVDSLRKLKWEAWVCLPKAPLHICCPKGNILTAKGDCMPQTDDYTKFMNSALLPDTALDVGQFGEASSFDVPCIKGLTEIELASETPQLIYSVHQAPMLPYINKDGYSYWYSSYCIGYRTVEESLRYYARFCEVHKCCHDGQYLDNGHCYFEDDRNKTEPHFLVDQAMSNCTSKHAHPSDVFHLESDGSLHVPLYQDICQTNGNTNKAIFDIDRYCLHEGLVNEKRVQIAIVCHNESRKTSCMFTGVLHKVLMGLSSVFLILTLCVYIGVKNLRERTYGRCLVSLVSSLLVFYISYIVKDGGLVDYHWVCVTSGFMIHMSSLATFFWLSVMGFDMQKTLTSSRRQSQSRKLFIRYSAYAWGCSLSIALTALILELIPRTEYLCHLIRPEFQGTNNLCYFNDIKRRWIYHYWVILLLTIFNSFFFLHVVIFLFKNQKRNKALLQNPDSGQTNMDRQNSMSNMWLYMKLFLVMGITWIIEVVGSNNCEWLIGDIFNLLQGVFIFIITVCKRDVYKKVKEAWSPQMTPTGASLRTPMSISSRGLIDSNRSTRTSILSIFSFTSIGSGSKSRKASLVQDPIRNSRAMSLPMHTLHPNIDEKPEGAQRKILNHSAASLHVPAMEDSVSLQSNLSIPSANSNSPSRKTSNNSSASLQLPTVQE